MVLDEIIRDLNAKKVETGLSNQQISDISQVPKSTVDRILRGGGEEPRARTLLDIAAVFDYTIGPAHRPDPVNDSSAQQIIALYESQILDLKRQLNLIRAEKNRVIRMLGILVAVLVLGIFAILLIDALNPTVGWFRGTVQYIDSLIGTVSMDWPW